MPAIKSILLLFALLASLLAGCRDMPDDPLPAESSEPHAASSAYSEETSKEKEASAMTLTIGNFTFTILPEENETASALREHLPLQLEMKELNGNEKYFYLPFSLPSEPVSPREIHAGDVMLYGDDCLVVFYESFSTPYRYTRIGRIEDVSSLRDAVGTGDVQMTFSAG